MRLSGDLIFKVFRWSWFEIAKTWQVQSVDGRRGGETHSCYSILITLQCEAGICDARWELIYFRRGQFSGVAMTHNFLYTGHIAATEEIVHPAALMNPEYRAREGAICCVIPVFVK